MHKAFNNHVELYFATMADMETVANVDAHGAHAETYFDELWAGEWA